MPKPKHTSKPMKPIPEFATEDEEREFWATHDTTEYFDWSGARRVVLPDLKPSTTPISMRLPETLLSEIKRLAHEQDVPYQSLMKVYLAERVAFERGRRRRDASARLDRDSTGKTMRVHARVRERPQKPGDER